MIVFTITITQGVYEDKTERTLIFSSLEKLQEWKDSYKTSTKSFYYNGREYAQLKEVEVDTNKIISRSHPFIIDLE